MFYFCFSENFKKQPVENFYDLFSHDPGPKNFMPTPAPPLDEAALHEHLELPARCQAAFHPWGWDVGNRIPQLVDQKVVKNHTNLLLDQNRDVRIQIYGVETQTPLAYAIGEKQNNVAPDDYTHDHRCVIRYPKHMLKLHHNEAQTRHRVVTQRQDALQLHPNPLDLIFATLATFCASANFDAALPAMKIARRNAKHGLRIQPSAASTDTPLRAPAAIHQPYKKH